MSLKKILYVDHTAALGGGEIALLSLVQNLDRSRFLPIVTIATTGPLQNRLLDAGIETYLLPLTSTVVATRKESLKGQGLLRPLAIWQTLNYAFALARMIRQHKIDIVHTNSLKSDLYGGIAARLARVPVIWHIRDRITEDYLPELVARTFRRLCRYIPNVIIANSKSTLQTLQLPTSKPAYVVYSGTNRSSVLQMEIEAAKIQSFSAGDLSKPPIIGLIGRLSPWKGQHIFIEAAVEVLKRFPNARFQIIGAALFGEESYEAEIRKLAGDYGLADSIEFTGFRNDIPQLIASMNVLVHASTLPEPFGQVIIDGMAAGKPVIATRGGGAQEIVLDGVTGTLVEMGNAPEMAEAIVALLNDPLRAQQIGNAGRERVLELFTLEQTMNSIHDIYDRFATSRK